MKRRDHRYKYDEIGEAKMTLLRRFPLLKRNNQSLGKSRIATRLLERSRQKLIMASEGRREAPMPSPEKNNDKFEADETQVSILPEHATGQNDQIEQPAGLRAKVLGRRWTWTESCQPVIEKCDVWTAILKIPQ
jgi:hypothetical protein